MPRGPQGEVSRDGLANSWQSGYLEGVQALHEGHLCGRPSTSKETVCPDTCGGRWWSIQPLEHSWRPGIRPQGSRQGMGRIWEKLQTINFILAFQKCLSRKLQAGPYRVNHWPRSTHQADSPGVPMEEGSWRGVNGRFAVPCHNLLGDP